jgi:hypothetical protein
MAGHIPFATPKVANGKFKWRKRIKFWKGEKLQDGAAEPSIRSYADDSSFGISSATTANRSARSSKEGSPQRLDSNNGSGEAVFTPLSMRSLLLPAGSYHAEDAMDILSMSVLPFEEGKAEQRPFPEGAQGASLVVATKTPNPREDSYQLRDNSILHTSDQSLGSKQNSFASVNNSTIGSDRVTASAFVAAPRVIESSSTRSLESVAKELLSANVQLVHEVHTEKENLDPPLSFTGACLSLQNCQPIETFPVNSSADRDNQIETKRPESRSNTATSSVTYAIDAINVDQEERKLLRQKMRLAAIQKELFDDSAYVMYNKRMPRTIPDYEDDDQSKDDYNVTDTVLDKIGSYFCCVPRMPLFFTPTSRGDDVYDDGTYVAEDDDASYTIGTYDDQTLSTYENGDGEFTDDGGDSCSMSNYSYNYSLQLDKPDDSSYADQSYTDQSHIYIMSNTRQKKIDDQKSMFQTPYQTISAFDDRISNRFEEMPPPLVDETNRRPSLKITGHREGNGVTEASTAPFGWMRHFQRKLYPTESYQNNGAGVQDIERMTTKVRQLEDKPDDFSYANAGFQEMWLQAIHEAIEKERELLPSSLTLNQRRTAAQAALRRMLHEAEQKKVTMPPPVKIERWV